MWLSGLLILDTKKAVLDVGGWLEFCSTSFIQTGSMRVLILFFTIVFLSACRLQDASPKGDSSGELYFPTADEWATSEKSEIGITDKELSSIKSFLEENNTRAFLILKDGKIVVEEYFGKDLLGVGAFNKESSWYWASAGKTLTAFSVGLAQEKGFLNINHKTSDYLGQKWSSLPKEKQDLIKVSHQLTMTSGLDLDVSDSHCFAPECLQYKADAGKRWDYHNGSYTLLHEVIAKASNQSFDLFFEVNLRNRIGMNGFWQFIKNDHVYFSTARSFARFGLLVLNEGNWEIEPIMTDKTYFKDMVNTSQNLNEAYGYLWWLNGKSTGMIPGLQQVFKSWLSPNAPEDMIAAMGKNGQLLNIVPSQNLVVIRMGDAPGDQIGLKFQNDLWAILAKAIDHN